VRELRALEPATLSLLTDRRRHSPRGLEGGDDGRPGRNLLNGRDLPPKVTCELHEDDVVTVETPGGGGWGM
jgi:N-methylhydantoinase B